MVISGASGRYSTTTSEIIVPSSTSSGCESTICATTNARCKRERLVAPLLPPRMDSAIPARVACSAGERPKRIPLATATPSTNANVPKSGTMFTPSISVF